MSRHLEWNLRKMSWIGQVEQWPQQGGLTGPELGSQRQVFWMSAAGDKRSPKSCFCSTNLCVAQALNSMPTLRSDKGMLSGIAMTDPQAPQNIFCSRCRNIFKNLFFPGFSWINVSKRSPNLLFFYMKTKIAAACQVCWEMDVIIFNWTASPKGTR